MPCLIKQRTASSPGIITFTQGETLFGVLQKPEARKLVMEKAASGGWIFGVHLQGNTDAIEAWKREPWQSFIMWPDRHAKFLRDLPDDFVIGLNCINFMPSVSRHVTDEVVKFWDICVLSRAATVKRIGPTLYTIRRLMDRRPDLRVVFVVPDYRDQSQGDDTYRLRYIDRQYFDLPRALFTAEELGNLSFLSSSQVDFGMWPLANEIVVDLVRKSRFVMLLSHTEGTARALGDALQSGTPVIVSEHLDDGQRPLLTRERSVLIPDDYDQAAAVIDDALRNYERFRMDYDVLHDYYDEASNRPRLREALSRIIRVSGRPIDGEWFLDQLHQRLPCHGERTNYQFIEAELEQLKSYFDGAEHHGTPGEDVLFAFDRAGALCRLAERYLADGDLTAAHDAAAQARRFDRNAPRAAEMLRQVPLRRERPSGRPAGGTWPRWLKVCTREGRAVGVGAGSVARLLARVRAACRSEGVIRDQQPRRGDFAATRVGYDVSLNKEIVSRKAILERHGENMKLLDVGGGSDTLKYLLGTEPGLRYTPDLYSRNKAIFDQKYQYFCLDIVDSTRPNAFVGDICDATLLTRQRKLRGFFDVAYSNNAFEHFPRPWVAAENMVAMVKRGGLCVVIAPFSLRYHEVPGDYFRFTHTGLASLFVNSGEMRVLVSGYDIHDRRVNWQGGGENNDLCPVDQFGAWRENWFVVVVLEKL